MVVRQVEECENTSGEESHYLKEISGRDFDLAKPKKLLPDCIKTATEISMGVADGEVIDDSELPLAHGEKIDGCELPLAHGGKIDDCELPLKLDSRVYQCNEYVISLLESCLSVHEELPGARVNDLKMRLKEKMVQRGYGVRSELTYWNSWLEIRRKYLSGRLMYSAKATKFVKDFFEAHPEFVKRRGLKSGRIGKEEDAMQMSFVCFQDTLKKMMAGKS